MGYSIIFETKFIKLEDGRLLHLDRSGCNNDTQGRKKGEFEGKIYTYDELQKRVISFVKDGKTEGWDLKIGSKDATYYDYGKHLARMANKAKYYDEFINERYFSANRYDGVKILKPIEKIMSAEEFSKEYSFYHGELTYRRLFTPLKTEKEIINALDNGYHVEFYVGKENKVNR